jgi:gliding motility-associated-like protein
MKKESVILILLLLLSVSIEAQSTLYKKLSPAITGYEVKVFATPDGGWITGGTSSGVKLIKYDKCGQIQWSKHYTASIDFVDLVASKFGGYFVTGYSGSIPFAADTYLLKLDANGNVVFCREYQATSNEYTYTLDQDNDGNLFINGNTLTGSSLGENFIIKTDSLGNIIWSNLYAQGGMWARATLCSDGSILRCGGHSDIYKVDTYGNVVWAKYRYWWARNEPVEVIDGYVFGMRSSKGFLCKTDFHGNLLWITNQYSNSGLELRLAVSASGNPVAISGSIAVEFDRSNGQYIRHNNFVSPSGSSIPNITDAELLKNNHFIMAGYDASGICNIKTDSFLSAACADTSIVIDTIAPLILTSRDTIYTPSAKSFITAPIVVTANDFDPLEQTLCSVNDPVIFTTSIPDSICNGESQTLSVISPSAANNSWSWYEGNCGESIVGTGTSVNVSPSSTQTYYVRAEGCDTTPCVPVTVYVGAKPEADFNASFAIDCSGITANLVNESENADIYSWTFSDGFTSNAENVSHLLPLTNPISMSLTAMNTSGCSDTLKLVQSFISLLDYFNVEVPNIFSPNNDGINDQFGIISDVNLSDCLSITVYDRWGTAIFSSEDNNFSWDGTTASGLAAVPGTYFYIIVFDNIEYNGYITLVE